MDVILSTTLWDTLTIILAIMAMLVLVIVTIELTK